LSSLDTREKTDIWEQLKFWRYSQLQLIMDPVHDRAFDQMLQEVVPHKDERCSQKLRREAREG
jgi:hypothetical protein